MKSIRNIHYEVTNLFVASRRPNKELMSTISQKIAFQGLSVKK